MTYSSPYLSIVVGLGEGGSTAALGWYSSLWREEGRGLSSATGDRDLCLTQVSLGGLVLPHQFSLSCGGQGRMSLLIAPCVYCRFSHYRDRYPLFLESLFC